MDPVILPVLMAGVGVAVVAISMGAKQAKMLDEVWEQSALRLDGQYVPRQRGRGRSIIAKREGREIQIDHQHMHVGDKSTVHTRIRCAAEGPPELKLRVTPAGGFSGLARAVGFEDVPVGDADFDAEYVIKASDPEIAPMWLHRAVRKRIQAVPDFRFKLERGRVEAVCPYVVDEPSLLVKAADAVVALADGRARLVRAWRKLAREHGGGEVERVPAGWARVAIDVDGVPVTVATRDLRDRHFTTVTAETIGRPLPAMVLTHERHLHEAVLPHVPDASTPPGYALYCHEPDRYPQLFDQGVLDAIASLEPAKVRLDPDRVTVLLPGVELRRRALRPAIALAARLAGRGEGPAYR